MSFVAKHFPEVLEEASLLEEFPFLRRRARRPARSIRLVHPPTEIVGHVVITVAGDHADYTLERLDSAFGSAFRLTKCSPVPVDHEPSYDVLLASDGRHSCECRGHLAHNHCKHVSGLLALQRAGKL